MIEIHLYGKLRRFAECADPTSESILTVDFTDGDTVGLVVDRIGIPLEDLGSNVFVNGRYANLSTSLLDGARVGLFPDDMQLLYKWYFASQKNARAPQKDAGAPQDDAEASSQGSRVPNQDSAPSGEEDET